MKLITAIIIVVIVLGGGYYFLATAPGDDILIMDDETPNGDLPNVLDEPDTADDVQRYFNERLQEGVLERIGQPIEGFVPQMFLTAFSGLAPQDFDGADALLGFYQMEEKELGFVLDSETSPIHSAAEALSREGMMTVFENIQRRANVVVATRDDVDGLILFLGAPLDDVVTACLPEQRNVDACIEIYQPVCALVNVQCVTTPCDPVRETYANSCKACSNSLVSSYAEGECLVSQ